jgi:hypothetical protein
MTDREQLERLVQDMETVKSSLRNNQGLIREMMIGGRLWFLSLIMGLATVGFALISHFLSAASGGFQAIPLPLRSGLIAFIALVCACGVLMKFAFIDRRSKEIGAGIGIWRFVRRFYSNSMLHTTIASLVLMAGGSVLAAIAGHPWLAVPIVACAAVLPINAVADVTGLGEYSATGYASLAGGAISYFLVDPAPFLALAVASGALYFSFAVCTLVAWKRRGRR